MLVSLTIRNVVLIDRLELRFHEGLCVLTGETGAGKSILLDALGLALGARGDSGLVLKGAGGGDAQAVVAAEFAVSAGHPALGLMAENGLEPPAPGEALILRRVLSAEGRSRALINDQPVSAGLMREVGEMLVEIEGQFASRGLLNDATHRETLDAFGGLDAKGEAVRAAFRAWRAAVADLEAAEAAARTAREEEDYLRHVAEELDALDPQLGEEDSLAETRALLQHGEMLGEAITAALAELTEADGADARLARARRTLTRVADKAGGRLDPVIDALDRIADQAAEAIAAVERAGSELACDPGRLEAAEERLFALRAAARKHRTTVDALPALRETFHAQLAAIETSGERLESLRAAAGDLRAMYVEHAEALSAARGAHAKKLDAAVKRELKPLKLEKAVFQTSIERLDEARWGETGIDHVAFEVSTNKGTVPGPLARIASGGELARIMLALKVVLSEANPVPTLVFDEVDSGIGGATAAAVGERLNRLGQNIQVLVVTHSPQVAARGAHHLRVIKSETKAKPGPGAVTRVDELSAPDRTEEIARMIAGARVTDEARAAAAKLMSGHGG